MVASQMAIIIWTVGAIGLSGYVGLISKLKGGLTMNNVTQAERNAIQQMDDQVYGDEAESYFENEEEKTDGSRDCNE